MFRIWYLVFLALVILGFQITSQRGASTPESSVGSSPGVLANTSPAAR